MPTIQEAIKHPAFKTLPPEEQRKVFSKLSPEYNGLPPEEQDKVLSRFSPDFKPKSAQTEQPYSWKDTIADTLVGGGGVLRNLPLSQRTKQTISNVADPTLRGVGMGVGGIAGNAAMPIYGGMSGAGVGQAAGGAVADTLKRQLGLEGWPSTTEELAQQGRDVLTGATWEGIGQTAVPIAGMAGKGIKKAYNYLTTPIRQHGAQEAAAKQYDQLIKKALENDLFRRNTDEAIDLGEEIGTTFTKGQASNAPSVVLKERALARSIPGGGEADMMKIAQQNKAIGEYYGKEFPGVSNISTVIDSAKKYGDDLTKQVTGYQDDLTQQMSQMRTERTPYQSGETIRQSKYNLANRRRPVVEKLFNEVPNVPVDITPLVEKVDDIEKFIAEHPGYRPEDIPSEAIKRVKDMIKSPAVAGEIPVQKELIKQMEVPGIFQKIRGITSKINIGKGSPIYDHFEQHEIQPLIRKQPTMFSNTEGMRFDEIASGLQMDSDDLAKALRDSVSKSKSTEQAQSQISSYMVGGEQAPVTIPFQQLREERNNIYKTLHRSQSNLPPNDRLLQKTNELKQALEDSLNNIALHPPEVSQKYQSASDFYKKYYLPLKQGVSREITAKNALGEYRLDAEKVPQKIFNSVTDAKQFMSTLPKSEAKQAMKDYTAGNLIGSHVVYNPQTGDINPKAYNVWLKRNGEVLKELGIHQEFDDISKVATNLEVAKNAQAEFDKSNLAKILGVNPENAIAHVFSGTTRKNSTVAMQDLINQIKKTPEPEKSLNGLRKSFADYFVKNAESNLRDVYGQPIENVAKGKAFLKENLGAMQILYKDQPEKIKALMKVQRGYEIMLRNQRSPFPGGGSPTAEHLFSQVHFRVRHRILRSIPIIGDSYIRLEQFGKQQADAYLMRALYDPEYAYTLTNTIKNPALFDAKVKGQLMSKPIGTMMGAGMSIIQNQPN